MALIDQLNLSNEQSVQSRIQAALYIAAQAVLAEDSGTANHAARLACAHDIIHNPASTAKLAMAALLTSNGTVVASYMSGGASAILDSDLQYVCNTLFTELAS